MCGLEPVHPGVGIMPDGRDVVSFRIYRNDIFVCCEKFTFSPRDRPAMRPIMKYFTRKYGPREIVTYARLVQTTVSEGAIHTRDVDRNELLSSLAYEAKIFTKDGGLSSPFRSGGVFVQNEEHTAYEGSVKLFSKLFDDSRSRNAEDSSAVQVVSRMPVQFPIRRTKAQKKRLRREMRKLVTPLPPVAIVDDYYNDCDIDEGCAAFINVRIFLFVEGDADDEDARRYTDRRLYYSRPNPPTVLSLMHQYTNFFMKGKGYCRIPAVCCVYNSDTFEDDPVSSVEHVTEKQYYRLKYFTPDHECLSEIIYELIDVSDA